MNDDEVTMKTADFHALFRDATRWRAFERVGHLMIVDFNRRESGIMPQTKRSAVDACIETGDAGEHVKG